ncbi:MAG TPA: biosynthetic arginine decarboxylase [Bdellovibrionota bacterium]|jgi:arginine decarboxylase|nr:biosynthetic arginine decarboxylase [Bdellovibrionota bacterium]
MKTWGVQDSLKLYNVENWGGKYFHISPEGNLQVHARQSDGPAVDLTQIVAEVKARGLDLPVVIRFQDIIRHRVVKLNEAFREVIAEAGYKGHYQGVYPIKVNQMREVVEEIVDAGWPYDFGLEAGSKAELAAVIAMEAPERSLVICNGYKDYTFIKTALLGLKLGKHVIIVVEKLTELYQVIEVARELNVMPRIGIRTKLNSKGSGKWEGSGGEHAKFGLTTPELLHAVAVLKQNNMEQAFELVHFHIGSQISNIRAIKDAVKETARIYAKLRKMGVAVQYLDVGGGLGVDYDGSRTDFESSVNYSIREYVSDIVYSIKEVCDEEEVPTPNIVSESGRALVAHHSVLVVNVFGKIAVDSTPIGLDETADEETVVKEMRYIEQNLGTKNLLEMFHDAMERKEQAQSMFRLGYLSLEDRAKVDFLFWRIAKSVYKRSRELSTVPDEIKELDKFLADQYLCNFSVFQSMLDHWAIKQLFPIMPIHRLNEEPSREATLVDITCDSDGKVCKFIDPRDIKDTLPLHELKEGEPYTLGIFLMGAYQDIMGDLHNLFGRVNEVHVFLDETEPGGYYIEEVIHGNKIKDVLSWIQYSDAYLAKRVKTLIDLKARAGDMKPSEGVKLQDFYEEVLAGYTYMDGGSRRGPSPQETKGLSHENPQPGL